MVLSFKLGLGEQLFCSERGTLQRLWYASSQDCFTTRFLHMITTLFVFVEEKLQWTILKRIYLF